MDNRSETCCFTGHRDVPAYMRPALARELEEAVRGMAARGKTRFAAGGAVGFDTMAAETVLRLRREVGLELVLILPCADQARRFSPSQAAVYSRIKAAADEVVILHESYLPGCMQERNRALVDSSSACIAFCRRATGGTAYTLPYARSRGLEIYLLGGNL